MKKALLSVCLLLPFAATAQVPLPYHNNFESDTAGWYVDSVYAGAWEWNVKNDTLCPGSKGLGVGLTSTSFPLFNTHHAVCSPVFTLTMGPNATLFLHHKYSSVPGQAGVWMEYRRDFLPWAPLGAYNPSTTWYNVSSLNTLAHPAWSGSSDSCIVHIIPLSPLGINSTVQFRFIYYSPVSTVNWDAYFLDDFCLCYPPCNCAPLAIAETMPGRSIAIGTETGHLVIDHPGLSDGTVDVYDLTGKRVARGPLRPEHTVLPLPGMSGGIYMVQVRSGARLHAQKILILD